MKSVLATTLGLTSLAAAAAIPGDVFGPRTLPLNWKYAIKSLKGPGCPDFGKPDGVTAERTTRLTFGQNTLDGSEIYYWFVAYPHLRVSTEDGAADHSWCETEITYKEYKDAEAKVPADDYRLRLHKNGTRLIATYDLEAGIKATAKFTYQAGDEEVMSYLSFSSVFGSNVTSIDRRRHTAHRSSHERPVPEGKRLACVRH